MNGKLLFIQNQTKLYDSIILPGYWQRSLDWRRRGWSFARGRRGRPVVTALIFWRL
jgi:hypothetical protein